MKRILFAIIFILVGVLAVTAFLNMKNADVLSDMQNDAEVRLAWGENQEHTITMEEIRQLKSVSFPVVQRSSGKTPAEHSYTGVELKKILQHIQIPVDKFSQANVKAVDGYTVAVSMQEIMEDNNVYLTFLKDDRPLGTKASGGTGPYQLIIRNDTYAQRWCKFVAEIKLQ